VSVVGEHAWWLASRAAGIVALLAITASVGLGLWASIRAKRRPGMAVAMRGGHEHLALVGLVSIAVHGVTLLGDPYLDPGVRGIAVPFAIDYRPVWVATGLVGAYLAVLLGLSFYARKRLGAKRWRSAHRLAVFAYVLSVVHTLGAGTDASTVWMRTLLLVTGAPIVALFLLRVSQPARPTPAPRRAPAAPA
jgi:methionine sulfoxide reductase heme-binding subunit